MKKRFNEKNILALVLIFAVIMTGGFLYQTQKSSEYKEKIRTIYRRSFTELSEYIKETDTLLQKALVSNDSSMLGEISDELGKKTELTKTALEILPLTSDSLYNTSNYITQVSDYVYSLDAKLTRGEEITQNEKNEISSLLKYSEKLSKSISDMETDFENNNLTFEKDKAKSVLSGGGQSISDAFSSVEEGFSDYPTLIYDGPFSEHIINKEPEITKQEEIKKDEAKKYAENFSGKSLEFMCEQNGKIPCFMFSDKENNLCVSVSKNGGKVVMMTENKTVSNPKLSPADASKFADKFLKKSGYDDMIMTGYETNSNITAFSYASKYGGYTVYSDLVKIKVSLSDGSVLGFEANGYLANHKSRFIPTPVLSESRVRERISSNIEIKSINLALIPKKDKSERPCYEVKGICNGKTYLIYINTNTGKEENILILKEDENASLTV